LLYDVIDIISIWQKSTRVELGLHKNFAQSFVSWTTAVIIQLHFRTSYLQQYIYAVVYFYFLNNFRFQQNQKRSQVIGLRYNFLLVVVLLKPIAREHERNVGPQTLPARRGFCEHFRDEHERGVMDLGVARTDGWRRARVHPRWREAKGHVTGGRNGGDGRGWEEVEVSWFLRCRTEMLSVPQELSCDTDVCERLSTLPCVTDYIAVNASRVNASSSVNCSLCAFPFDFGSRHPPFSAVLVFRDCLWKAVQVPKWHF